MGGPKAHHYVPRTYLRAWQDNTNKLWVYNKSDNSLFRHSTVETVMEGTNFYGLSINDPLVLSDDDLEAIFKPLNNLNITIESKQLKTLHEYRDNFNDFDNWQITNNDGTLAKRKMIFNDINKANLKRLEDGWNIIENDWAALRLKIEETVNSKIMKLYSEDIEYLENFIIGQEWRTPSAIDSYKEMMNSIKPIADLLESGKTEDYDPLEEFAKALFLKNIGRFQDNDINLSIGKGYKQVKDMLQFVFIKAKGKSKFLTSDNPVFTIIDSDFENGRYNGQYMPLSPEILIGRFKGNSKEIMTSYMDDIFVNKMNEKIISASREKYVSSHEIK